jgi:hypothetical protein
MFNFGQPYQEARGMKGKETHLEATVIAFTVTFIFSRKKSIQMKC